MEEAANPWQEGLIEDVRQVILQQCDPLTQLCLALTHQKAYCSYARALTRERKPLGWLLAAHGNWEQWEDFFYSNNRDLLELASIQAAFRVALEAGNMNTLHWLASYRLVPVRHHFQRGDLIAAIHGKKEEIILWLSRWYDQRIPHIQWLPLLYLQVLASFVISREFWETIDGRLIHRTLSSSDS